MSEDGWQRTDGRGQMTEGGSGNAECGKKRNLNVEVGNYKLIEFKRLWDVLKPTLSPELNE